MRKWPLCSPKIASLKSAIDCGLKSRKYQSRALRIFSSRRSSYSLRMSPASSCFDMRESSFLFVGAPGGAGPKRSGITGLIRINGCCIHKSWHKCQRYMEEVRDSLAVFGVAAAGVGLGCGGAGGFRGLAGCWGGVFVVVAHPAHWMRLHFGFVAAVGDAVEEVVNAEEFFETAAEGGVSVVDIAGRILGKNAEAGGFFRGKTHRAVVVDFIGGEFFLCEGDAEILIERAAGGRGPRKAPAHSRFE